MKRFAQLIGVGSLAAGVAFAAPPESKSPQKSEQSQQQKMQKHSEKKNQQAEAPAQPSPDLVQKTQKAFGAILGAQEALQKNDKKLAQTHLTSARQILDEMYGSAEGSDIVKELDKVQEQVATVQGTDVQFAPLSAAIERRAVFMDPDVVAGVEEAQKQHESGQSKEAADTLRLARQALVADFALLPVEAAYARVVAAGALLEEGKQQEAQRLLSGVPVTMAEMTITTPMVPVRFNLRAAAEAAEAKDWKKTEQLLDTATSQIQQLHRAAEGPAAKELEPIVKEAKQLQKKADGGKKVSPDALRALARRTTDLGVG